MCVCVCAHVGFICICAYGCVCTHADDDDFYAHLPTLLAAKPLFLGISALLS